MVFIIPYAHWPFRIVYCFDSADTIFLACKLKLLIFMFKKVKHTAYPPKERPLLVWDGNCGFCHYWALKLRRLSDDKIDLAPYQDVASDFPDIPFERFESAAQLIEPDGSVYSGPASLYRTRYLYGKPFLHKLYTRFTPFRWLSDIGYQIIANNRGRLYGLTVKLFGKRP